MAYNILELDGAQIVSTQVAAVTSTETPEPGEVQVSSSDWTGTFADHDSGDPSVDVASTNFTVIDPVHNIVEYTYTYEDGDTSVPFYGVVVGYDANYDAFIIQQYSTYFGFNNPNNELQNPPHYTIASPSQDLSTVDASAPTLPLEFAAPNVYPAFLTALLAGETLPSTVIATVGPSQVIANADGTYTVTGGSSLDESPITSAESFANAVTQTKLTIAALTSTTKISVGDVFTVTVVSNGLNGEQPITASYKVVTADVSGTAAAGYHNVAVKLAAAINSAVTDALGYSYTLATVTGSTSAVINFITPTETSTDTTFSGATVDVTASVSHTGSGTLAGTASTNTPYASFNVDQDSSVPAVAGDVYSITIQSGGDNGLALNGGAPYTVSYTVQSSDLTGNVNHNLAVGLAGAINADPNLQAVGITAEIAPSTGIAVSASNLVELYAPNALDDTVVTGSATSANSGNPQILVDEPTIAVTQYNSVGGNAGSANYQVIAYDQNQALIGYYDPNAGEITSYQLVSATSLDPSVVGNVGGTGQFTTPITLSSFGAYTPPPCFTTGTRIATPQGETAVEMLRIGDKIVTASGEVKPIKWLGRRSYGGRAVAGSVAIQPVRIRAGALGEGLPTRDLVVSPQHAMLIDGMFIPAAALVNEVSITRCRDYGDVTYIHIELDNHEAILAEGAATETFVDCDSRAMFENAAEFAALYPDHVAGEPVLHAPRVEAGDALEAVRQRLFARSGRRLSLVPAMPGALRGHVERISEADGELRIEGWVLDSANPTLPVRLAVLVGGRMVMEMLANRYRSDLEAAGFAGGRCAFDIVLPMQPGAVELRRACDNAVLPVAPEAASFAMAA